MDARNFTVAVAVAGGDPRMVALALAYSHIGAFEEGGENKGAIVRAVMSGHQGDGWEWCAGFATWMYVLGARLLLRGNPFQALGDGRWSSSALYRWAKQHKLLVAQPSNGDIFLVRGGRTGHSHTGIVAQVRATTFKTVEGNVSNSVLQRTRKLPGDFDFIHLR